MLKNPKNWWTYVDDIEEKNLHIFRMTCGNIESHKKRGLTLSEKYIFGKPQGCGQIEGLRKR